MSSKVVKDASDYLNQQTGPNFDWIKRYSEDANAGTLFMLDMPPSPDAAVAVMFYSGESPSETFGNPLHTRHPRIQVMVRDPDARTSLDRATAILELFAQIKDQVINGTRYARFKPVGEATELGPDSDNRQRATVNFAVSYYG